MYNPEEEEKKYPEENAAPSSSEESDVSNEPENGDGKQTPPNDENRADAPEDIDGNDKAFEENATPEPTQSAADDTENAPSEDDKFEKEPREEYYRSVQTPPAQKQPKKKGGIYISVTAAIALILCFAVFAAIIGVGAWKISENSKLPYSSATQTAAQSETAALSTSEGGINHGEQTSQTENGEQTQTSYQGTPSSGLAGAEITPESTVTSNTSTPETDTVAKCYSSVVEILAYIKGEYTGMGSGVIYTTNGYIITNYHVAEILVYDVYPLYAKLSDGSVYEATYVCGDFDTDIAVIKIEKDDCTPATIGNSDATVIGEEVWAIGNPGGGGQTVTYGHISALNRSGNFSGSISNSTVSLSGLFITDAAINGGNSGGGLFNAKGELIGIVNGKQYYSDGGSTVMEGMGYAIPIAKAVDCINTLVYNGGYIPTRAKLGVTLNTGGVSLRSGLSYITYKTSVTAVSDNSAAKAAGIQVGDIITALGGVNLLEYANEQGLYSDYDALRILLLNYKVGDKTTVTVLRASSSGGQRTSYSEIELEIEFIEFNYIEN